MIVQLWFDLCNVSYLFFFFFLFFKIFLQVHSTKVGDDHHTHTTTENDDADDRYEAAEYVQDTNVEEEQFEGDNTYVDNFKVVDLNEGEMAKTFSEGTSSVKIVKYISPSKLQGGVRFKRAVVALKSPWSVGNDWRTKLRHTLPTDKFEPKTVIAQTIHYQIHNL